MPGTSTTKMRNDMLDSVLGGTKYVGLFTDARGGTPAAEATTGNCPGYARQAVTHAAASTGAKATNAAVTFTASGAWATVRYLGVWDAATAGNLLYWTEIGSGPGDDKVLGASGDTLVVNSGQLSHSITA